MKKTAIIGLSLAALLALSFGAGAQKREMNIFNWSEYIDPQMLKDFEKKENVKINYSLYESNEDLLAKLETGSKYDLVFPGQYILPVMARKGLLQPLDKKQLPNFKNLSKKFVNPSYDPDNKYSIAYQWGTVVVVYNKKKVPKPEQSWSLLFDPKKQQGNFLMMDSTREMLGPVMKFLGASLNTTDTPTLKKALATMSDAKKRSLGFDGGVGVLNKVSGGQANYGVAYNGDCLKRQSEDPNIGFFVPKEGGPIFVDSMAIPAGAKSPDLAHKFINYILDAKIGAHLSNYNRYATPNEAAKPFINAKDAKNPGVYPPANVMDKVEFIVDLGDNNKLYDALWTKIKAR